MSEHKPRPTPPERPAKVEEAEEPKVTLCKRCGVALGPDDDKKAHADAHPQAPEEEG